MSAATNAQGPSPIQNTLKSVVATEAPKGHPKGLYFLFFTEMWERFGYYGMRALLVLYMINYLQKQPAESSNVYKWYTSLVYLTPLAGGFIADRFLGLRLSVIIGGALMAVGYFTVGVQALFYPALALIIAGNGFFKPNISTMVGKMYRAGDARRDGAFTIFYMGINLGAFLAPIILSRLKGHFGFGVGFAGAGVGMIVGLVIFLVGQKRVAADVAAAGNDLKVTRAADKAPDAGKSTLSSSKGEDSEPGTGGVAGLLAKAYPLMMIGLAVGVPVYYAIMIARHQAPLQEAIMPIAFAGISGWMGFTLLNIKGASRDRSSVIFILFMFAVLFWMAFEQAGNALNIWADIHTDRHLFGFELETEDFQSANAIFIFTIAPLFAMMWTWLSRKGKEPPTALKMLLAMIFMVLSFGAMVWGAAAENRTVSTTTLDALPAQVDVAKLDAGRISFDAAKHELSVHGVLPVFALNEALAKTASPEWVKEIARFEEASKAADKGPVTLKLTLPASFEAPLPADKAREAGLSWDAATGELTTTKPLTAVERTALVNAGAQPEWRRALRDLEGKSQAARVTCLWLILSYLLATLGELCLSPVGLSMVTKLAPARFASLFMGVWLLASSVAQYAGGAIGESWGTIAPTSYFMLFVYTSIVGVAALVLLVVPLRKLMHQVH